MTGIQWTDETWNPVRGCSRVSAGCDNCYAMGQAHRFSGPGKPYEGLTTIRRGRVDWTGAARLHPEMLTQPLKWRKPRCVFVNSMSDLFHHSLSNEEIAAVFGVMAACPQHTFQVLTKRPDRMHQWFEWISRQEEDPWTECHAAALDRDNDEETIHCKSEAAPGRPWPLPNVWPGVSCENQPAADERIPRLLRCPAALRWVSVEPQLGRIDLEAVHFPNGQLVDVLRGGTWALPGWPPGEFVNHSDLNTLDWVVVGGESGHRARPFDVAWATLLRDQCKAAGVPFFLKQLGAITVDSQFSDADGTPGFLAGLHNRKGDDPSEWPPGLRVREFPEVRRG